MSERNPVAVLDIRLVEDKLIDETFFQDYQKVHEKLERVLERAPKPLDAPSFERAEEQLLAWLHGHEARKDAGDRLTSLLRCGLGHLCVAMHANAGALGADEIVSLALRELRSRGWSTRNFDPEAAAIAAAKYAALEKKSASARPTSRKTVTASGKTGARKKSEKEVFAMSDPNQNSNAGMSGMATGETAATKAAEAKPKAARKPAPKKPAAKKVAEKKAPAKKAVAKKPAVKKPVAKKVAAKKPVAKKVAAKKPAVKKVAAKKPAVKKVAAKKPIAKKVAAKKPAVKKVAAKKPVAKKVAAKKPAVKKVAAKKPVAKKAAPKKAAAKK